ncbi:MAG TPA: CHAT domain-containing protein [Chitinophagaceae bacterium]
MKKKAAIQLIIIVLLTATLYAQCPIKDSVEKDVRRIAALLKSQPGEQQVKLIKYRDIFKKCFSTNDSTYSNILRLIGRTYFYLSDYLRTVEYSRQSIDIITSNANSPSVRLKDLINGYYFLSTYYDSLNNIAEKINAADECISIAIKLKAFSNVSFYRSLYTKIEYYFDIGDYYSCINTAESCEKYVLENEGTFSNTDTAVIRQIAKSSFGWHINALFRTGNFEKAGDLLANKVNEYKKEKRKDYLALTYAQLAEVYEEKGDDQKALLFYNMAFTTYKNDHNNYNCKQTLNNIGQAIFNHSDNNDKALDYYRRALRYKDNGKFGPRADALETLNIFGNIANVYERKVLYDSAFKYFQLAFNQLKTGIDETGVLNYSLEEFLTYKKIHYLSGLVIDKGDAYLEKYRIANDPGAAREALRIYKVADRLLDKIRTVQSDLDSKLLWRKDSRRLYVQAIEACYLLKDIAGAFYFFEKSRAVVLNDQLTQQRWLGSADISKRAQIKKKMISLQAEASGKEIGPKRSAEIQDELFTNTNELRRLEESIRVNSPLYYHGIDSNNITTDEVKKKLLKTHQALLEVFVGDSSIYTLLITPGDTHFTRISKTDFEIATALYVSYLQDRDQLNRNFTGFRAASYKLYKLIFQNYVVPKGRIIISPDGNRYFPFESLVTDNNSKDPIYFLVDHAVSYTYSARYLMNDFGSNSTVSTGNFLGIAPIHYPPGFHLPALSGSDLSLKKIGSHIDESYSLLAEKASRKNFLQQFTGYKIIQLYTHASDSSDKKEPIIFFADSSLYLSDLVPEHAPATQLIVLAACKTGKGKLYQGEGVFSFSRGFAAIGIPSSISNLWSVDNISTYRLTEYFYEYLSQGLPVDVALQKAKLEFLTVASGENKLPYYWASAILLGKTDPVKYKKPGNWKLYILMTLIGGIIILGLWKYNRKTKQ